MKAPSIRVILLILLIAVIAIVGSLAVLARRQPAEVWTPAPVARATVQPTHTAIQPTRTVVPPTRTAILPTTPQTGGVGTSRPPTATRSAQATAVITPATRPPATLAPPATATLDPHLVIITEADIQRAIASGATAQSGLISEGLAVRFTGGKVRITASKLAYGPVQVQNLDLVGRLGTQNGQLQLETESVSPRNLVTALIPTMANQALAQFAAQWYIEEVKTLEGRLEVRIR